MDHNIQVCILSSENGVDDQKLNAEGQHSLEFQCLYDVWVVFEVELVEAVVKDCASKFDFTDDIVDLLL